MADSENRNRTGEPSDSADLQSVVRLEAGADNLPPEQEVKSGRIKGVGIKRDVAKKRQLMRKKDPDASLLQIERPHRENPEDAWDRVERPARMYWLIGSAVVVVMVIAAGILWAVANLSKGKEKAQEESKELAATRETEEEIQESAEKTVKSIEELVKGFVEAKSVDEMSQYVRFPSRVKPLMKAYYQKHGFEGKELSSIEKRVPVELGNRVFWVISYEVKGENERSQMLVGQDDEGSWAVDWESKVVYQPNDWIQFRKEKATEPTLFRAYLELIEVSPFYGFEFSDYKKYRAFKITLKDQEGYLWGYTVQGDANDKTLMGLAKREQDVGVSSVKLPVIVKLRYLKDSMSDRCVMIDEIVASTWTFADSKKQPK